MKGDWREVTIGDECLVTDFVSSGSFASLRENVKYNYEKDYAVLVRTTDYTKDWQKDFVYVSKESFDFLRKSNLRKDDVVISNVGAPGVTFKVPDLGQPMTLGPNAILVRTHDEDRLRQNYIYRFFESPLGQEMIQGITSGTTQLKFNKTNFRELRIPAPSATEQQRIVAKLDAAFEALAEAQAHVERNRANARELFESYLNGVFEGKGGWKETTLGEIGKVCMCKRILKEQTTSTGDIPFYKIGTFGKEPDAYIPKEIYEEFKRKYSYPKKGDVLISASGTIGRGVVYDGEPAYFQDSNIVWIDNNEEQVLNEYLFQFYKVCEWSPTKGATISRLYNDDLRKARIAFPTLQEQRKLVAQMVELDAQTKALEATYEQKLRELEGLKKGLLGAAFRGEL